MLRLGAQRWEIFRQGECKECTPLSLLRDRFAARQWLQQFKGNALSMGALRHMLANEGSARWRVDRATDDEIIDLAAELFGTGRWHAHEPTGVRVIDTQSPTDLGGGSESRNQQDAKGQQGSNSQQGSKSQQDAQNKQNADARKSAGSAGPSGSSAQPPPATSTELTWIEILLVDSNGTPVPGIAYEIKLPDGATQKGKLDVIGRARHERIVPGQCEVRFPELDAGDWKPA